MYWEVSRVPKSIYKLLESSLLIILKNGAKISHLSMPLFTAGPLPSLACRKPDISRTLVASVLFSNVQNLVQ